MQKRPTFEEGVASDDDLKNKVRGFKDALRRLGSGDLNRAHALEYVDRLELDNEFDG